MSQERELLDDFAYYNIAATVRKNEDTYFNSLYQADQRRADIETPVNRLYESVWVIFDGLQATLAKRKIDELVLEHDLVLGGENREFMPGITTNFNPNRLQYLFGNLFFQPNEGEEVSIYNSEIARRSANGVEVIMNANCIRTSEIDYLGRTYDDFYELYQEDQNRIIKKRYRIDYHESVVAEDR